MTSRKLYSKAIIEKGLEKNKAMTHKVSEMVVRAKYHSRWNTDHFCCGTIVYVDAETGVYKVYWHDNFIHNKENRVRSHSELEISAFKEYLEEWLKL
jgi:hypothetical protein